jgi:hypothetical protein
MSRHNLGLGGLMITVTSLGLITFAARKESAAQGARMPKTTAATELIKKIIFYNMFAEKKTDIFLILNNNFKKYLQKDRGIYEANIMHATYSIEKILFFVSMTTYRILSENHTFRATSSFLYYQRISLPAGSRGILGHI